MGTGSGWLYNEEQLLHELRTAQWPTCVRPRVAGYEDLQPIGHGGQSVVYSAVQCSTRRRVAVKFLLHGPLASPSHRQRFEREVSLIAGLQHPNIVRLYDCGLTPDDQPYYVMEYIDGVPLDQYLSGTPKVSSTAILDAREATPAAAGPSAVPASGRTVSREDALALFARICDAVGTAHQCGMVHRDIKPGNILVDSHGEPHVLDFGLGKSLELATGGSSGQVSLTGEFMGTLAWASPEQVEGSPGRITPRADVYALGVVLFHILTGRFPYRVSGGFGEVADQIRNAEAPRPGTLARGIDSELDIIVLKCLAKDPARRYEDANQLAQDIRNYLAGEPIAAKGDSLAYRFRKRARRHWAAIAVVVILLAVSAIELRNAWLPREAAPAALRSAQSASQPAAPLDPIQAVTDRIGDTDRGPATFSNDLAALPTKAVFPGHLAFGHGGGVAQHVVGGGASIEVRGFLHIGQDAQGTLEIRDGGKVISRDADIAHQHGSRGHVIVAGPQSQWSAGHTFCIGAGGDGTLNIQDGATVTSVAGRIGRQTGSSGAVTVDGTGSAWDCTDDLNVGYNGVGILTIRNGGVLRGSEGRIAIGAGGDGDFTIAGPGSFCALRASLQVGGDRGVAGGRGHLYLADGGRLQVAHLVRIWDDGSVEITGGQLIVDTIVHLDGGLFTLADGRLYVNHFHGDLINQGGVLAPAHVPQGIDVRGDYTQHGGVLELRLRGAGAEAHDRLMVEGHAALGGTLRTIRGDRFEPAYDDELVIVTAQRITGAFNDDARELELVNGGRCKIVCTDTDVRLTHFTGPFDPDPAWADPAPDGPLPRPHLPVGPFPRRLSRNTTGEHDLAFLGPPDDVAVSIAGQIVEYDFEDLRIVDGEGPDLVVYEVDIGTVEHASYDVLVSQDGVNFQTVKALYWHGFHIAGDDANSGGGFACAYDLAYAGMDHARYVRIDGVGDGPVGSTSGFDLDAVGAIHYAPGDTLDEPQSRPAP